jgi:arsenate reductase
MSGRIYRVLFLCTGNSARSILAEAILNRAAGDRFRAESAGSHPRGSVHPMALEILREHGYETAGLRSKSWDEFAAPGAAPLDFVFTVCDDAAGETCPVWPGQPMTAHWGIPDPAAFVGPPDQQRHAFRQAFLALTRRIDLLTSLRVDALDRMSLQRRLDAIGSLPPGSVGGEP